MHGISFPSANRPAVYPLKTPREPIRSKGRVTIEDVSYIPSTCNKVISCNRPYQSTIISVMNHINTIIDSASEPTLHENNKYSAVNRGCTSKLMDSSTSSEVSFDEKSSQPSSTSSRIVTVTNTTTSSNESSSVKDDSLQLMTTATRRIQNNNQHRRQFIHFNQESSMDKSSLSTNPDVDMELRQEETLPEVATFRKWPHSTTNLDEHVHLTASALQSRFGALSQKRSSFVTLNSSSHGNSSDLTPMDEDMAEPHSENNSASEHGSDGYSASASSNDVFCMGQSSCSSPSMSSSDDPPPNNHILQRRLTNLDPTTIGDVKRRSESSSDIADFSSTQSARRSSSPSSSCSSREYELTGFDLEKHGLEDHTEEAGEEEQSYLPTSTASVATLPPFPSSKGTRKRPHSPRDTKVPSPKVKEDEARATNIHSPSHGIISYSVDHPIAKRNIYYPNIKRQIQSDLIQKQAQHALKSMATRLYFDSKPASSSPKPFTQADLKMNETFMYTAGVDIMGVILSFLKPVESHKFLTMPLSKTFRALYTQPQELWKVLCLSEPFLVKINDRDGANSSGDESSGSYPICNQLGIRHTLGKYRLLYTSFIRCVRYLDRIKEDAINGRLPSAEEDTDTSEEIIGASLSNSTSLMEFFAQARDLIHDNRHDFTSSDSDSQSVDEHLKSSAIVQSVEVSDDKVRHSLSYCVSPPYFFHGSVVHPHFFLYTANNREQSKAPNQVQSFYTY